MNQQTFYNLSVITQRIQHYLQPAMGKYFWVKAEISSGREHGGSFYCDLVETTGDSKLIAKVSCKIWVRELIRIREKFKNQGIELNLNNGNIVGFLCSLIYSPQYGLSLQVQDADPVFAFGELELKKKQIIERLSREGLLECNKALTVPILPQRIGLITSYGSAAYKDFIETLHSSKFGFKIVMANSLMQGNKTEQGLLRSLDILEKLSVDIVVIIRGGGSKTDLYSLDNEIIARRIGGYTLPVWTGIGHDIDISILDYVANKHFRTPTGIAEELVARFTEMSRYLNEARHKLQSTWKYRLDREYQWFVSGNTGFKKTVLRLIDRTKSNLKNKKSLIFANVNTKLANSNSKISLSKETISRCLKNRIGIEHSSLNNSKARLNPNKIQQILVREKQMLLSRKDILLRIFQVNIVQYKSFIKHFHYCLNRDKILERLSSEKKALQTKRFTLRALDPQTSLNRGFTLVYNQNGNLVKSISQILLNDVIITQMSDGQVTSIVNTIMDDNKNE